MVRYRQRIYQHILRVMDRRWDVVRTKTTELLTCMFAFALSWCTRHNLVLIATVDDNEWS